MDGLYKSHACLARPANLLPAEKRLRHEHVAILSGFNANICAFDLKNILDDVSAKSIIIPRQEFKYSQRPWAYLSFASETQKSNAMDRTSLAFNSKKLFWSERDQADKLCLHCGNPGHLLKTCPLRTPQPDQRLKPNKWADTYERMRPVGHKPAHSRSSSKVRARPATRQEGFSYASAASSSGLNLDASIHSPANRPNTSRFPRSNNRSRSRPRFIPSSGDTRDNSSAHYPAPVELKEFSKQLERMGSLIE